jgi:hypothetical protein
LFATKNCGTYPVTSKRLKDVIISITGGGLMDFGSWPPVFFNPLHSLTLRRYDSTPA